MANTPQSKKRARQIERRTDINKARRSRIRIFLRKVEAWCAQFGLALTIPHGCEYQQLQQKQEA